MASRKRSAGDLAKLHQSDACGRWETPGAPRMHVAHRHIGRLVSMTTPIGRPLGDSESEWLRLADRELRSAVAEYDQSTAPTADRE